MRRSDSLTRIRQIPALLDAHSAGALADGSLVRFRCMVQDNGYAPEVYVPAAPYARDPTKWACLKYLEQPASEEQLAHDIQADTVFADKTVFYAVGVPAESTWVRAAHRQAGGKSASVTTEEVGEVRGGQ